MYSNFLGLTCLLWQFHNLNSKMNKHGLVEFSIHRFWTRLWFWGGLTDLQLSDLLLSNVPCVDDPSCPIWTLHCSFCSFRPLLLLDCKVYFCRDLSSFELYASSSSAAASLNSAGTEPQSHCCFGKDTPLTYFTLQSFWLYYVWDTWFIMSHLTPVLLLTAHE